MIALEVQPTIGLWRHVKRGTTYAVLGVHEVQAKQPVQEGDLLVAYIGTDDGKTWARPISEFLDGRFTADGGAATDHFKAEAEALVRAAALHGVILTIEQNPLPPLRMGNYETVVSVREVNRGGKD